MKKNLIIFLLFLILPSPVYAICGDCDSTFSALQALVPAPVDVYTNHACGQLYIYTKDYPVLKTFCGPTAKADALAYIQARGQGSYTSDKGTSVGCSVNSDAGWIRTNTVIHGSESHTCSDGINTYTYETYISSQYFALYCNGDCPEEYNFCISKGWSCANGDAVALEITLCDVEGFPTSSKQNCGDMDTANKIDLGIIDGQVFSNPNCGCSLSEDDVVNLCAEIDATKAKCDDCSTKDSDSDGVNDCDDWCPDTPSGSIVSDHGCPENDSDGDGVLDGVDQCPDTPPNTQVDAWGCPIEQNPDSDVDGDGVPDIEDNCPYEGGTVDVNGCPIYNPQPEPDPDGGDQDNDNPLLEGIIGWLKKLTGETSEVGEKIDGLTESLEEFTNTEGTSTELSEDEDFNGDLPEDFEEIDLESDFMSDFLGGLLQNNAFIQQITGSTLTASGSCSLSGSISVLGRSINIDFSICEYDLTVFRAMILMIAGLTGFFIVFRKG